METLQSESEREDQSDQSCVEEIGQEEQIRAAYYYEMEHYRGHDEDFMLPDDEPLTPEEIAAIDAYWGRFAFAYPKIDYKSFETFKNRCGHFDVRHCPAAVRTKVFREHFVNRDYGIPFQDKGLMEYLYPDFKQPHTLFRQMNGSYFDENFTPVSMGRVVRVCNEMLQSGKRLIVKPSGRGGGKGIRVLNSHHAEARAVRRILETVYGSHAIVIQEMMDQSPFMKALNPSSVNTVRITTLFWKGRAVPLAALVRIGSFGSSLDNWCSGGSLLGIDIQTGQCLPWALGNDLSHVTVLPTGVDLEAETLVVPNFQKIKDLVCRAQCRNPYLAMISWDIALDPDDEPVFIECNISGMFQIHEATTGPVFGEFMDDICEELLLKQFYFDFTTEEFDCREYSDHVEIARYRGEGGHVTIPEQIRGKPVTHIDHNAFARCEAPCAISLHGGPILSGIVNVGGGKRCYFSKQDGRCLTGTVNIGRDRYCYFSRETGWQLRGLIRTGGGVQRYFSHRTGLMLRDGRYKVGRDKWVYTNEKGIVTGKEGF